MLLTCSCFLLWLLYFHLWKQGQKLILNHRNYSNKIWGLLWVFKAKDKFLSTVLFSAEWHFKNGWGHGSCSFLSLADQSNIWFFTIPLCLHFANYSHKIIRLLICYFPLIFLSSKNVLCVLNFQHLLYLLHFRNVQTVVFSASVCRTTSSSLLTSFSY